MAASPAPTLRAWLIVPVAALLAAVALLNAGPAAGQTQPRIVYTLSGATYNDGGTGLIAR